MIFSVSVSIAECRLQMYSMKNVAIFNMSMTVLRYKLFPVTGQRSHGKGYLLVGHGPSWRFLFVGLKNIFCKKTKK